MNALKNLKFLTMVGAAATFLCISISTASLADSPNTGYVVVNVVNNNPDRTKGPLKVTRFYVSSPNFTVLNDSTLTGQATLTYAQSAFVKYVTQAFTPKTHDDIFDFTMILTMEDNRYRCMIQVFGSSTHVVPSTSPDSAFCNKALSSSSGIKDNTLTVTVNYNGP